MAIFGSGERFQGFPEETFQFFREIATHSSDKAWFEENKERYREHVLKPIQALVEDLGPFMQLLDPQFDILPKVNHTISRIYRDTRFSRKKTLLRDHLWVVFRRHQGRLSEEVSYYFEIWHDHFEYGMGFYSAPREWMRELQQRILANPERFRNIALQPVLRETFTLDGKRYTRSPFKEFPEDLREWFYLKSFYFYREEPNHPLATSPKLVETLKEGFLILYPMYCFIQKMQPLVNVEFNPQKE
jgi:uncharacterized protein (TIGR02453 family)